MEEWVFKAERQIVTCIHTDMQKSQIDKKIDDRYIDRIYIWINREIKTCR